MPRALRLFLLAALTAGVLVGGPSTEPVRAYPESVVRLSGHGWGHGRGMGQFGAQGYALAGRSYTEILDHFYGGTTLSTVGNDTLSVRITRKDNQGVIVLNTAEHDAAAVYIERIGANAFRVQTGPGCAGPWSGAADRSGPIGLNPDTGQLLGLCDPAGAVSYRGSFEVKDHDGSKLINHVATEDYVKGVVPRESPASFHMEALKAQAVAARSYARAFPRDNPYALQCDTTKCQVYGGASGEAATTNAATDATAGQVRKHANGAVASTEFSSSTGGYTAGGTFPAVIDEGDSVSSNPNHNWTAEVPVASIEAAYPEIGSLFAVSVTKRNGLGDWGGRVLEVVLRGSGGSKAITGDTFRSKFGLKSDWFLVTNSESGGVDGYWVVAPDGGIFAFGMARFHGSMGGIRLNQPVVGMAATPDNGGYWQVARDGGIFSFGNAKFHGSTGAIRLNQPVVGMAPTKDGGGYWLVASDGGIFAFGNAKFHGSMGATRLNQPVVGMAPTPSGEGYWLVAADGGIFAFGDARFHGSTGAIRLNSPVTGMAATRDGQGYWLVASDGGLFAFGNATFFGSLPGIRAPGPAEGIRNTTTDGGYLIVTSGGRIYPFGDAPWFGDIATGIPGYRGGVEGIEVHRTS
ncbi:MAG: SpoIID/LytB domain-containing protein [Actinomycetota bacterium]|nr:SpoIID/LytB domain-containing protein [Actinomycetota bacterium]